MAWRYSGAPALVRTRLLVVHLYSFAAVRFPAMLAAVLYSFAAAMLHAMLAAVLSSIIFHAPMAAHCRLVGFCVCLWCACGGRGGACGLVSVELRRHLHRTSLNLVLPQY